MDVVTSIGGSRQRSIRWTQMHFRCLKKIKRCNFEPLIGVSRSPAMRSLTNLMHLSRTSRKFIGATRTKTNLLRFFLHLSRSPSRASLISIRRFVIKMDKWILTSHYDSLINNKLWLFGQQTTWRCREGCAREKTVIRRRKMENRLF